MKNTLIIASVLIMISVGGCKSAYYKTMEKFGKQKSDLLVNNVTEARDSQEKTKEQFKSALEKFTEVANFDGGNLKEKYELLKSELEKSEKKAKSMQNHIDDVETVAEDLFEEWQEELEEYSSDSLRKSSAKSLQQTKVNYSKLISAMKKAEAKIEPVLSAFRDQVLFLKHNLNAQAIASLQNELVTMESDIASLISEMEKSISEADEFIDSLNTSN